MTKAPPLASRDAERAVLGSLLINPSMIYEVRTILRPADFSNDGHKRTFQVMLDIVGDGRKLDYLTLCDVLEQRGELQRVGHAKDWGRPYITGLISATPTFVHATTYAQTVHDYAVRRQLLEVSARMAKETYTSEDVQVTLSKSLAWLGAVDAERTVQMQSSKAMAAGFFDRAQVWLESPSDTWGLSTGIHDLDRLTGGLERGEYVILAGRPSTGKSALSLQIARHVAEQGHGVAFFSLEMGPTQLMMRLACSGAQIDSHKLRRGKLTDDETQRLVAQTADISDLPIWWCCRPGITVQEAANETARLQLQGDISLVVVDYIQLMASRGENQNVRVGRISQGLKGISTGMDCCVLALSQLSRAIERRPNPTPQLSDLRDSGSIEQDSDKVLFIDRKPGTQGTAKLILAKNRNGPSGRQIDTLVFREKYAVFVDMARGGVHASR